MNLGISLGLVGLGMFGRHFIELFLKHPDVERFALCDLRKDRLDTTGYCEQLPKALASQLGGHEGSEAYLVHELLDSVNRQRLPRVNVWEAVRYCAPGIVAHQLPLQGGKLLKVPDWGDPPDQTK